MHKGLAQLALPPLQVLSERVGVRVLRTSTPEGRRTGIRIPGLSCAAPRGVALSCCSDLTHIDNAPTVERFTLPPPSRRQPSDRVTARSPYAAPPQINRSRRPKYIGSLWRGPYR